MGGAVCRHYSINDILPEKRRLLNPYFITLVIAIIVAVIVAMLLFANTSVMSAILTTSEKFENLGESESTFGTRLELWGGLLATLDKKLYGRECLWGADME